MQVVKWRQLALVLSVSSFGPCAVTSAEIPGRVSPETRIESEGVKVGPDNPEKKDGKKKSDGGSSDSKGKSGGKDKSPGNKEKGDAPNVSNGAGSLECRMDVSPGGLSGLSEASGVALSRRTPGILWSHGDSYAGEPVLHAFDSRGAARGKVRIEGVSVTDWEDVAVGPCGGSNCLYIADIGDNQGARKSINIQRIPEPLPTDASVRAGESFRATFPDGPHDAEAFFVSGSGEMFVVTKGENGPIAVYRYGASPKAGGTVQLQKVGVLQDGPVSRGQWITGAGTSPDGKWIALRTHGAVFFYDSARLLRGDFTSPLRYDAGSLRETQGEGVALGPDGALYLVGEGGRKGTPGTLASGTCRFPRAP